MKDIGDELFFQNLNDGFQSKVKTLVNKKKKIVFYERFQLQGSAFIIICFLIYSAKDILLHKFSLDNITFFICALSAGGFFILIEKILEPLKKDYKKDKEAIKDKMIIKICKCSEYCECKDEFNEYMESMAIKILS